jgi:C1A family cysteine protease
MRTTFTVLFSVLAAVILLSGIVYAQQDSVIDEIQKAIEESGAKWSAAVTPITNLSWEEKQQLCGTILEAPTGPYYKPDYSRELPDSIDWRNIDGVDWVTPVTDQRQCGSCWAFGACAAFESRYGIVRNDPFILLDLSEQFMVSCSNGSCGGYSVTGTMNFLENTGTTDEDCFPYYASDRPCSERCEDWEDRIYSIDDWEYVNANPDNIMNALLDGPLTCAFSVFDDFNSYSSGVYEHVWGDYAGGHMVGMVGYNAVHDPPYWICKNSWNSSWGMDGYFYIAWGEVGINNEVTTLSLQVENMIEGTISETTVGDSLEGVRVEIQETGQYTFTEEDGSFRIGSLSDEATLIISHYKYYADTSEILILGSTLTEYSTTLTILPISGIDGNVHDSVNDTGVRGRVILKMNDIPIDTVNSAVGTGDFVFDGIPVSNPPYTTYTGFEIQAQLPYPASTEVEETLPLTTERMEYVVECTPAEILLVDDDEGMNYEDYFLNEVEATGLSYVHFDVNARDTSAANYLSVFPSSTCVVWFTGDATENTITEDEEALITSFLNSGGKLFLTGQNIAEDLAARSSTFLSSILHVEYTGTSSYFYTRGTEGDLLGDNIGLCLTLGSQGGNNQDSRDLLEPLDGAANECVFYVSTPVSYENMGTAGVWLANPTTQEPNIVFFGFGFEAILSGNPIAMSRDEVLSLILQLYGLVPTGIGDDPDSPQTGSPLPRAFAMLQNYPNPFNPSTTIQFHLPESEGETVPVLLEIFNLRGQKVRTLLDNPRKPGSYVVRWDGKDDHGKSVGSGIYLYRIVAGEFNSTKKMVLLK